MLYNPNAASKYGSRRVAPARRSEKFTNESKLEERCRVPLLRGS